MTHDPDILLRHIQGDYTPGSDELYRNYCRNPLIWRCAKELPDALEEPGNRKDVITDELYLRVCRRWLETKYEGNGDKKELLRDLGQVVEDLSHASSAA